MSRFLSPFAAPLRRTTVRVAGFATPVLLISLAAGAAPGADAVLSRGAGDFVFTGSPGALDHPVRVWYHRPAGWRPDDPIVFVMHGTARDGANYREAWAPEATRHRFLLVVPEFSARHYPRSEHYQQGNVLRRDGTPVDSAEWSFTTIEALFDEVRQRTGSQRAGYRIYGHSGGAQFVHRMLLFMPNARVERAAVANAGWYTLPTLETPYPYGLGGVMESGDWDERLRAAFARDFPLFLSTADTVSSDPTLRVTPEAMEQGRDRFARGHTFYATAQREAAKLDLPFNWRLQALDAVGHSNRRVARLAAPVLAD
jgi:hypothetical protein